MENETTEVVSEEIIGALEQIERASIDMQIATARNWPRKIDRFKQEMMGMATEDEDTAASCFYTIPRQGKMIQGPSVRLAEIAISCYGNLRSGTRTISTVATGESPHVVVQGWAMDLQKNTAVQVEKRRRITKKKNKPAPDDDDIQNATNACAAIAKRDAAFNVIPRAYITPVFEQCKRVAVGDMKSIVAKRAKVLERLKLMGATEERILAAVEVAKVEDIDLPRLETLLGLGTAIKDGATSLEEAFPSLPTKPKFETPPTPMFTPPPPKAEEDQVPMEFPKPSVEEAMKQEPKPEPPLKIRTAQEQLQDVLTEGGFTFTDLQAWAKESGNFANPDSYASVHDLPRGVAQKLANVKEALLKQLAYAKGQKP